MKKIEIFTYYSNSTKEEIDLTNSILKGIDLNNEEQLFSIKDSILNLPFNKQLQIIHCIVDTMYDLSTPSAKNSLIEKFIAQKEFNPHRNIILTIVDDDIMESEKLVKLNEFGDTFNINIIDSNE